jgi:hypothetical protein
MSNSVLRHKKKKKRDLSSSRGDTTDEGKKDLADYQSVDVEEKLDKEHLKSKGALKHVGIFKRLPMLDPGDFVQYAPELRDAIVRKYVVTEIRPAQVMGLMKKSDKVYSQIINSENDAEYLRIGKEYIEDIYYPGAPTADRVRARWKKTHITKIKVKKNGQDSDDEANMDVEEIRIKRLN